VSGSDSHCSGVHADLASADDKVAVRFVCTGTHQKEYMGVGATGKSVSWEGMSIFRVAGGKFVEEWELLDAAGLMHQLTEG